MPICHISFCTKPVFVSQRRGIDDLDDGEQRRGRRHRSRTRRVIVEGIVAPAQGVPVRLGVEAKAKVKTDRKEGWEYAQFREKDDQLGCSLGFVDLKTNVLLCSLDYSRYRIF